MKSRVEKGKNKFQKTALRFSEVGFRGCASEISMTYLFNHHLCQFPVALLKGINQLNCNALQRQNDNGDGEKEHLLKEKVTE